MFPLTLLPFYVDNIELVRLGSIDDGGYVVPIETITSSSMLISCGINDNWDFEKDFAKKSKTPVWGYDYSIDGKFWYSKFKKDLIKFLFLKIFKPKKIYKMVQYIDFIFFFKFNKKNRFFLKKIGNEPGSLSLIEIVNNNPSIKKNIFLKIDIEGSEYSILKDIINLKNKLQGIVIEFHDVSENINIITNFIDELKTDLYLVHIHGNNYSVKELNKNPEAIELTFSKKSLHLKNKINDKLYPIANLDYPNSKRSPDVKLSFK
jgi:hypothetical protein